MTLAFVLCLPIGIFRYLILRRPVSPLAAKRAAWVMGVVGTILFVLVLLYGKWSWWQFLEVVMVAILPPLFTYGTLTQPNQPSPPWRERPAFDRFVLALGYGILVCIGIPMLCMLAIAAIRALIP